MKTPFRLISVSLFTLTLAACGGSGSSSSSSSTSPSNSSGGACGAEVINDYNSMVVNQCRSPVTTDDVNNCKTSAQSFLNKYPNINCQAEKQEDGSTKTVKASDVQDVVNKLNALNLCGSDVISDHNAMSNSCHDLSDSSSRFAMAACKSAARAFIDKHPGVSCQAESSDGSSQVSINASDAQKVIDILTAAGQ